MIVSEKAKAGMLAMAVNIRKWAEKQDRLEQAASKTPPQTIPAPQPTIQR